MKKLVISVATVGLTMCNSGGAVDPAPQPLICSNVGDGGTLSASATANGSKITITINSFNGQWKSTPSVSNVVGATVVSITSNFGEATIVLDTSSDAGGDAGTTSGSFTLKGNLTDNTNTCPVARTFSFNGAQITQREDMPPRDQTPATIEMMGRDEREVRLRTLGVKTDDTVVWTVTDGELRHEGGHVRWILPEEPGLYQVEVLVDRDRNGVALDTLVMEVT